MLAPSSVLKASAFAGLIIVVYKIGSTQISIGVCVLLKSVQVLIPRW